MISPPPRMSLSLLKTLCSFFSPPEPPSLSASSPPPLRPKRKTSLLSLAPELLLLIASHLPTLTSLNSLSRTNHRLYALLHPQLLHLASTRPCPQHTSNRFPHQQRTVVHYAAQHANIPLLQTLLSAGGTRFVNTLDGTEIAPLCSAVVQGHLDVASLLLAHGADTETRLRTGLTALHIAVLNARLDMVLVLLEAGADSGAVWEENGFSVLHSAVVGGDERVLEVLLERGCAVRVVDTRRFTAVALAKELGREELVRVLGGYSGRLRGRFEAEIAAQFVRLDLGRLRMMEKDWCRACLREEGLM